MHLQLTSATPRFGLLSKNTLLADEVYRPAEVIAPTPEELAEQDKKWGQRTKNLFHTLLVLTALGIEGGQLINLWKEAEPVDIVAPQIRHKFEIKRNDFGELLPTWDYFQEPLSKEIKGNSSQLIGALQTTQRVVLALSKAQKDTPEHASIRSIFEGKVLETNPAFQGFCKDLDQQCLCKEAKPLEVYQVFLREVGPSLKPSQEHPAAWKKLLDDTKILSELLSNFTENSFKYVGHALFLIGLGVYTCVVKCPRLLKKWGIDLDPMNGNGSGD